MRGTGRVIFAATLLLIAGVLNIIYGIGALDGANIFVDDSRYVLDDLNTLGWVLIVLGAIQLIGGFSLMSGAAFGRFVGDPRGHARRDRSPAVDRRRQSVVVAGDLLPLHLRHPRHLHLRRRSGAGLVRRASAGARARVLAHESAAAGLRCRCANAMSRPEPETAR